MIRIFFYTLILFVAVLIGLFIHADPGYVLMAYRHWTMEMPLWFFIIAFIVILIILHYGFSILDKIRSMIARFHYRRHWADFYKTSAMTNKGLVALAEANWKLATKYLQKSLSKNETPLVSYLALAYVAQMQYQIDKRDNYLQKAQSVAPENSDAVLLTQAKLQLQNDQFEKALASLKELHQKLPKNSYILKLLKRVYVALEDWESLLDILPKLQKTNVLTGAELHGFELDLYAKLFKKHKDDFIKLESLWAMLPKNLKTASSLLQLYAKELIEAGQGDLALSLIADALQKEWSDDLCALYGKIASRNPEAQFKQAKKWLNKYSDNATIYLCLGEIAEHLYLFDEAEEYLLKSLDMKTMPDAYLVLARVYEATHQKDKALSMFHRFSEMV